jgi:hypothetical protein
MLHELFTELKYKKYHLTTTIDLAQIGKTPYIPKSNRKANAGQEILDFVVPFRSLLYPIHRFPHVAMTSFQKRTR